MNIVVGYPPNWETLKKSFPDADLPGVVITYDGTLYNPSDAPIADHLIAHEEVHAHQQKTHPGGMDAYMKRYTEDARFRLETEVEAYIAQLRFIRKHYGPGASTKALWTFADNLSSSLYKGCITKSEAVGRLSSYVVA